MTNARYKIKDNDKESIEGIKQNFSRKHPWLKSVFGLEILLVLILLT